jgi:hypothetical protein
MLSCLDLQGRISWPPGGARWEQLASLYADDAVAFFTPVELDLRVIKGILSLFQNASGLATNYSKSHLYTINCSDEQISLVCSILSCPISDFSCTYLGVPLSIRRLPKSALQPLIDKAARRIPPWKGSLLNRSGRLIHGDHHRTLGTNAIQTLIRSFL